MAIKFLVHHTVDSLPPVSFKAGQVVKNRSESSEMHFVRRGLAGYIGEDGKLTDIDGKVIPFALESESGDDLDKKTDAQLAKIAKGEKVTLEKDAGRTAIIAAIRAHRDAAAKDDGLDALDDAALAEKVTEAGVTVEAGADRAAVIEALREHAKTSASGQ